MMGDQVTRHIHKDCKTPGLGRGAGNSRNLAELVVRARGSATEEQIAGRERALDFVLPAQVREIFLLTAGIDVSTGIIIELSGTFNLTMHGERYCVLGEFWKEADGDQLLLRPGEETIWYYAHEQDKVKRLCNDMTELLEKKLARYLNEH